MIMKKIITASMLSLLLGGTVQAQSLPVYLDDSKPIEDRIEDALSRITVEEKVALIHAQSKFSSPGVARLGIPEFWMTDGPHGCISGTDLPGGNLESESSTAVRTKHRRRSTLS